MSDSVTNRRSLSGSAPRKER
uniref:Uncharacterized protein n=1 Tax=Anguilla anguilla TaxID=7936 RepID=A0A0E9VPI1_ANGAN